MRETPLRIALGAEGRKLFRLDQPNYPVTDADTPAAPETVSFFDLLWKKINRASHERRGGMRHAAVAHEIWVGWSTATHFVALDGLLVNISRGGARIVLGDRPPRDRPVWVYKEIRSVVSSVRGDVLGMTPAPGGAYAVRVQFTTPCPTLLCESAVCGPPTAHPGKSPSQGMKRPAS
jgi:hypothetical protein